MRSAVLDKIASVTLNCRLPREVKLGKEFPCREGDVVAVRIRNRKSTYNQLELTTGRFSLLKTGDVVAGALGHRRALMGYAGHLPETLAVGDVVHLLNVGAAWASAPPPIPTSDRPSSARCSARSCIFPISASASGCPPTSARTHNP